MQIDRLIVTVIAYTVLAACSTAESLVAEPAAIVTTTSSSPALAPGLPGDELFANCPQGFGDQPAECAGLQ